MDFNTNKRVCEEVAIIPTKRLRNKIAGFTTHVMKRIQRGPVRGISLKLQEEERERRMDFVPEQSAINTDAIEVDRDSMEMLRSIGCGGFPGLTVSATVGQQGQGGGFGAQGGFKRDGDRPPRRDGPR
jgi:small subunit ribosomal protein S17e